MDAKRVFRASQALTSLEHHAAALAKIRLPLIIGKSTAHSRAAELVSQAVADGTRAAELLAISGFESATINSVTNSIQHLGAAPMKQSALRRSGTMLQDTVRQIQSSHQSIFDTALTTHATSLLRRTQGSRLTPRQFDTLEVLARNASVQQAHPTLLKEITALQGIRKITQSPHGYLTGREWTKLDGLLNIYRASSLKLGPHQLDGIPPLQNLIRDGEQIRVQEITRYFAAWRMAETSMKKREIQVRSLIAKDPESLTVPEWKKLSTLLDSDAATQQFPGFPGPHKIPAHDSFSNLARWGDVNATKHYFTIWRLAFTPIHERIAAASQLIEKNPSALSASEWQTLSDLINSDIASRMFPGSVAMKNSWPFNEHASMIARGQWQIGYEVERYFAAWRKSINPDDYAIRLQAALDELAAGGMSDTALSRVTGELGELATHIERRPAEEQLTITSALLNSYRRSAQSTKQLLAALQISITNTKHLPPKLETVRIELITLIEQNLARITGTPLPGTRIGYPANPDYSEIGRIRASVNLLKNMTKRTPAPALQEHTVIGNDTARLVW